jgi:hypothetical protein
MAKVAKFAVVQYRGMTSEICSRQYVAYSNISEESLPESNAL